MRVTPSRLASSLLTALAVVLTPALALAQTTVRIPAAADVYVSSEFPNTNYGGATTLRADTLPEEVSFLKFNVSLPSNATITSARLHLYTTTTQSSSGVFVYTVANTGWSESAVTFNTDKPGVGAQVGSTGGWSAAGWKSAALQTSSVYAGTVAFAVRANNDYVKTFHSSEGTNKPELEVTYTTGSVVDPAPNCIGEPADHPVVTYPEPRVFIEAQGWWAENINGVIKKYGAAEHLHIGACFPLQQAVSGMVRLDFRVVAHNLPAGSVIKNTRFHDGNGGVTLANITWGRTVGAGEHNVVVYRTVTVDTSDGGDGQRETRPLTVVTRPDGAEIHASGGWCWDVENGKTDSNHSLCTSNITEGRGWYDCFEYKNAATRGWTYPYGGIPQGQSYALGYYARDGAEGTTSVDGYFVTLDPDFHHGDVGDMLIQQTGSTSSGTVTLPGSSLTPGTHFLFIMSEDRGRCTALSPGTSFPNQNVPQDGEVSGGIRIPIKVNP
jgi:hypothetical protein